MTIHTYLRLRLLVRLIFLNRNGEYSFTSILKDSLIKGFYAWNPKEMVNTVRRRTRTTKKCDKTN